MPCRALVTKARERHATRGEALLAELDNTVVQFELSEDSRGACYCMITLLGRHRDQAPARVR